MRLQLLAALVIALFAGPAAQAAAPSDAPAGQKIPIFAWIGVPADQTSVARYRELAECGFTTSFSSFPDAQATGAALDAAQAAGVKLFIHLPQLSSNPRAAVSRFKDHPALAGYFLADEPNVGHFEALGKSVALIRGFDPGHPCYINLFPTYASEAQLGARTYEEYVRQFVKQVPVPFISFDNYPVVGTQLRGDWYQNLEIIRRAALDARKPFWAFALSVAHGPYPIATVAHLRIQAFSDLAYGAQCIQYFTYWTPLDSQWNFHEAPIDPKGKRTVVYDRVRQVNAEIQDLAGVFAGCRVLEVGHTGTRPAGTTPYQPVDPVRQFKAGGTGALVSHLRNGGQDYLAIVNRDIANSMTLHIAFDDAAGVRRRTKAGTLETLPGGVYDGKMEPGDIRIFAWEPRQNPGPR